MDVNVLNRSFEVTGVVDAYTSLIWTERYNDASDFEIYCAATPDLMNLYKKKDYLIMKDSDKVMIIDTVNYKSSFEESGMITVSGKSLEYILHKRLIGVETVLEGNVQNGILKLLNENAINPEVEARKIPDLQFIASTDTRITSLEFEEEVQYWGENLYDTICEICKQFDIGFRVYMLPNDTFAFELYAGVDHTFSQTENSAVVFSPEFGNLVSSEYYTTSADVKTAALVLGEARDIEETFEHNGVSTTKVVPTQYHVWIEGEATGLDREELFVDQTSLSMFVKDIQVPPDKYKNRLKQKGETDLDATKEDTVIEAEVDFYGQFQYGKDYKLGDILEVENELQMSMKVRITEFVRCHDTSGEHFNPAFTPIEDKN